MAMINYEKYQKTCENVKTLDVLIYYYNITSLEAVKRNSEGWMFISVVAKQKLSSAIFQRKSVSECALVAKTF